MSMTTACIKGKMGDIEYYQTTMSAQEAIASFRAPSERRDEWASLGIEERFQRELNLRRVEKEIAPYLATDKHRFFGSLVVLIESPDEFGFETLSELNITIPLAYRGETGKMGFLTVSGGENIVLDGQHRLAGTRHAIHADGETLDRWAEQTAGESQSVSNDVISVIFVKIEEDDIIRKIFNKINKHAKKTSTADDIITSMDDGCAFVTRSLMAPLDGIMGDRYSGAPRSKLMVNWRSNTVSASSRCLTSMSNFYQLNALILKATGHGGIAGSSLRPTQTEIDAGISECDEWWSKILNGVSAYNQTLEGTGEGVIPGFRQPECVSQLLFLPVGQWSMVKALTLCVDRGQSLDSAISRINSINFSSDNEIWQGLAFKPDGKILRNSNYKLATAEMIAYMVGSEYMEQASKDALLSKYREYKQDESLQLPEPVSD